MYLLVTLDKRSVGDSIPKKSSGILLEAQNFWWEHWNNLRLRVFYL